MPDLLVEVRRGCLAGRGSQFLDAIHAGIAEALHTPGRRDKVLRLVERPPEPLAIPGSAGERYTHIEITLFAAGPSRPGARSIRRSSESRTVRRPPQDVKIILIEVSAESVGMRGRHCRLRSRYRLCDKV